jgi:hypothetical protein
MLNRRDFFTLSGGLIIGAAAPKILLAAAQESNQPIHAGWIPDKQATIEFKAKHKMHLFTQAGSHLAGSGRGKKALLWKFFENVTSEKLVPHDQAIGDCVSHGWGLGVDILDTVQVAHGRGRWLKKCATEIIYAGGRVEIGRGKIKGDGMTGSWAGQWCRDGGILLRQPYLDGQYDFTNYSGSRARKWAHPCKRCTNWGGGVPDELEPLARKHPVKTITLVKSWDEARDAVYNGYPVAICSSYGFNDTRDRDGFARQNGTWYHCMLLAGMDDTTSRPGGLIINSWGPNWIDGPTRFGQPTGSFWADAAVINKMLKQEDSFAMSNYMGYPRQHLDYRLY